MSDGRSPGSTAAPKTDSAETDSQDTAVDDGGTGGGRASEGRVRASDLLDAFLAHDHGERIALGDLVDLLGDRAFGAMLLLLSIPNVLPVPGLSTVTGLPMVLIGLQMAAGRDRPWLPRRLAAATMDRTAFLRVVGRAHPLVARVERHLRPRLPALADGHGERLLGLVVALLAGVLALPIVFGNQPPAFAIGLIALGLIEKDGAFVLAGLIAGVAAVSLVAAVLLGLGEGAALLIQEFFG